jgi:WD40 repeat protein
MNILRGYAFIRFSILLLSAAFASSCGSINRIPSDAPTVFSDKASLPSSALPTRSPESPIRPTAAATLLSTKFVLPTSTKLSPTFTALERSRFRITFDYGSDAVWERLYPAYTILESAGYSMVRYSYNEARNRIGYGDPSCLPAIEDIQILVSDLVDLSKLERRQFRADDLAYGKKEIAIQIGDESVFLQPAPTQDSPFAPYLADVLPEFALARLGKGAINDAAISPSDEDIALATQIGVYLYRMEPGGALRELWFLPTAIPMTAVVFSPDGKTLACGSYNDLFWLDDPQPAKTVVMLLDPGSGAPLRIYPVGERGAEITRLAFSPDGAMLAAGYETSLAEAGVVDLGVVLLEVQSGKTSAVNLITEDESGMVIPGRINDLAFSPDGTYLSVGFGKVRTESEKADNVLLLNPATGETIRTLAPFPAGVQSVAFSPDGKIFAAADALGSVILWDTSRWEKLRTYATGSGESQKTDYYCQLGKSSRLAFSSGGEFLAAGMSDGRIHVWNAVSGAKIRTLSGQTSGILALSFSGDGAGLTSISFDRSVVRYKESSGEISRRFSLEDHARMSSVAFSPDNTTLAGSDLCSGVRVWDAAGRKSLHTFEKGPVAYSPDGRILATGGEGYSIILWDTSTWKQKTVLRGHTGIVYSIAFSPDGKTLASGGDDQSIILWDTATAKKRWAVQGIEGYLSNLAFSPDGTTLAHTADNSPAHVVFRDPATGNVQRTLENDFWAIFRVAFSPDGKYLIVVSFSSFVSVFHFPLDGGEMHIGGGGTDAAISPDGSIGASGSEDIYFKTVFLWDPASGKVIRTLPGHTSLVVGVAFSPDGKTLASASRDGTILLWDLEAALGN